MRSVRLVAIALLVVLPGCGTETERPEGIVERWIVSMNQGPAGEPWRWADDQASSETSPTWDTDEPGAIDAFSVGPATAENDGFVVPFRIERLDGSVTAGEAVLKHREIADAPSQLVVMEVRHGKQVAIAGGWWQGSASSGAWLLAIAVAVTLTLLGVLLVRLAARPTREPA